MGKITEHCRRESHNQTDKKTRCEAILDAWSGEMTAREVRDKLYKHADMNAVRPRITELCQAGLLVECAKKYDKVTGRYVTCWKSLVNELEKNIRNSIANARRLNHRYICIEYPFNYTNAMFKEVLHRLSDEITESKLEEQIEQMGGHCFANKILNLTL